MGKNDNNLVSMVVLSAAGAIVLLVLWFCFVPMILDSDNTEYSPSSPWNKSVNHKMTTADELYNMLTPLLIGGSGGAIVLLVIIKKYT